MYLGAGHGGGRLFLLGLLWPRRRLLLAAVLRGRPLDGRGRLVQRCMCNVARSRNPNKPIGYVQTLRLHLPNFEPIAPHESKAGRLLYYLTYGR
jgi:hypothetical protein